MDAKQRLTDLRNQLYNDLPTGQINSFELIKIIKNHLDELDNFINNVMSEGKPANSKLANCAIFDVSNSGNPLMLAKCDKCGRQILSWNNLGEASLYKDYDKDTFKYTGNIEQWVCNYCTVELGFGYDFD